MTRCLLLCTLLLGLAGPLMADVRLVRVPAGGLVPDALQDDQGVLHVTYGTGLPGDAFYAQSRDGGKTFSRPVQLNGNPATVTCGHERGPRLARGKDGVLHVVWLGHYQKGGGVLYTRSTDGGVTFETERRLEAPRYGLDNAALAADAHGNVAVVWTGGFPGVKEDPESPTASPIIWARSSDNGKTFTRNELLKSDHPASGRACGCCRLEAVFDTAGRLAVGFRGGYQGLRDPYLLLGVPDDNNFHCSKLSDDRWETECPMQGIPIRYGAKGPGVAAWMSRGKGFWCHTDAAGKAQAKVALPPGQGKTFFPLALPIPEGVFTLWQADGQLHWLTYQNDGTPRMPRPTSLPVTGTHKATALLGTDGHVYVVH